MKGREQYKANDYVKRLEKSYWTNKTVEIVDDELDCSDLNLTNLGTNRLLVKDLLCFNNKITKLPELPITEGLWCDYNELTALPYLPKIKILDCEFNKLTELDLEVGEYFFKRGFYSTDSDFCIRTSLCENFWVSKEYAVQCLLAYKLSKI